MVARADDLTVLALLNCMIREVAGPNGQIRADGRHVLIDLPRTGRTLRAAVRRPALGEPRLTGRVEQLDVGHRWSALAWNQVVAVVDAELGAQAGSNGSGSALTAEIAASHAFITEVLRQRNSAEGETPADPGILADSGTGADPADPGTSAGYAGYLDSEQSLIAGHRFHPAPKSRSGSAAEALRYAPETRSAFRLRYLAVPDELSWQREASPGGTAWLDRLLVETSGLEPPSGHRLLPVHPWQHAILTRGEGLPAALAAGRILDLGESGRPVRPTSSVRTVDLDGSGFLKLSLTVQITNCLRVNPQHELAAAVTVTRLMEPVGTELMKLFPGTVVLREPAVRTVDFGDSPEADGELGLGDQLGVIAREGLTNQLLDDVRPILAAALTEPWPDPNVAALLTRLGRDRDELIAWWDGYLALLLPPVLFAFLEHGVVFEAHLQNVVIGLSTDSAAMPCQLMLRDLEGVKLIGSRYSEELAVQPVRVRDHLSYSPERGWDRVAYCLFVNHLSSILEVLADRDPGAERLLWSRVRCAVESFVRDHGDAPQLRDVLAGVPVPAKSNLLTRWRRDADRDSGYVPVVLPLGPPSTSDQDHRPIGRR
ncbi:MAG TPA: IucA/IucC family protein [Kineosporiaceae bacterium]|nr:IucA/IucC family protein [Kineosporiaceae bacterium]